MNPFRVQLREVSHTIAILTAAALSFFAASSWSAAPGGESPVYETHIRPIFKTHCTHCHGEEPKPGGGVDLRLRRFMEGNTKDGSPLLVPGNPLESELLRVIREGEMPKKGKKLTADELAKVEAWVAAGAKISAVEPTDLPPGPYITEEDRTFWAFQPVKSPPPAAL
ncbi:MAG: hypothetical protein EBS01_15315, partial [Verrucomicrobia bacterium]|nr:hypothetical protein [Verrucomicrobiota bacterium]